MVPYDCKSADRLLDVLQVADSTPGPGTAGHAAQRPFASHSIPPACTLIKLHHVHAAHFNSDSCTLWPV